MTGLKDVTCRSDLYERSQLRISGVSLELMIITASASLVPRNRVKFKYLEEGRTFSLTLRSFFSGLVFVAYGELAGSSLLKQLNFSLVFLAYGGSRLTGSPPVRKLDLSASRRRGRNKGGHKEKMRASETNADKRWQTQANAEAKMPKQTRANADKRKQTLTPPNYCGFLHPPLQSP